MTSELPESGMATGNDETSPGGGKTSEPLNEEERAVLDELRQPGESVAEAVEDTPEAQAAVADDAPLNVEAPD